MAPYVVFTGRECADLVNLSTMTQMESYPDWVLCSLVKKSIVILSHFYSRTSIWYRKLTDLWCPAFTCRQVKQRDTKFATSFFISSH